VHRILIAAASVFCLALAPQCARALLFLTCTVSATPVTFGSYSPSAATPLTGTGTITMSCGGLSLLDSWTLSLSTGQSGSFAARSMTSGGSSLAYNLYTSAAHTQVWGDGSAGTGTGSGSALIAIGGSTFPYTVYGQISALQDKAAGTYTDVITVTVDY
jgi:spore coat protein U-like protein